MLPRTPRYDLPLEFAPWRNPLDRQAAASLLDGPQHLEALEEDRGNSRRRALRLLKDGALRRTARHNYVELTPGAAGSLLRAIAQAENLAPPIEKSRRLLQPGITVLHVQETPDLMGRLADALDALDDSARPVWAARTRGEEPGYLLAVNDTDTSASDAVKVALGPQCRVSTVGAVMDRNAFAQHLEEVRAARAARHDRLI